MGPKLMNCCKPKQGSTKGYGKMQKKRIQILEDGRVPAKEARKWDDGRTEKKDHKERTQKIVV